MMIFLPAAGGLPFGKGVLFKNYLKLFTATSGGNELDEFKKDIVPGDGAQAANDTKAFHAKSTTLD